MLRALVHQWLDANTMESLVEAHETCHHISDLRMITKRPFQDWEFHNGPGEHRTTSKVNVEEPKVRRLWRFESWALWCKYRLHMEAMRQRHTQSNVTVGPVQRFHV